MFQRIFTILDPKERNCYENGEMKLTYLLNSYGFRYSLDNCIIDNLIRSIIWNCGCLPNIAPSEIWKKYKTMSLDTCWFGEKLDCANKEIGSVYEGKPVENGTSYNLEKIGNLSKAKLIDCLPSCKVQKLDKEMSFALYPHKYNFFFQKTFCQTASHILQATCNDENRRYFLDMRHPYLCKALEFFDTYFGNKTTCEKLF